MVFSLIPLIAIQDAHAVSLVVTGGSYYYDGHPQTVSAVIKDGTGYTIQYSYYSIYEKVTWTEEPPTIVEPGSIVVYARAIKGTSIISHDPVILEIVGNAPEGSSVKIISHDGLMKAPVYKSANTTSEKVGELDVGADCTLISQDGNWFEITDGTITGYVYFEFLRVTSRPNGSGSGGGDITSVEFKVKGGTDVYDGNEHKVQASLVHGEGCVLEFSVDNGKTWTTTAPGLTEPGRITVKTRATTANKLKEGPEVVLQVLSEVPSGTKVKIKAHGSTKVAPIRKTPATSGAKLGTIEAGTECRYLSKDGDWIKIAYGSIEGYVYYWFVDLENLELKPVITTQPESIWAYKDNDAFFKVVVSGVGAIQYQWQEHDGTKFVDVTTGGNSYTYTVKATANKRVRCIVTDSNGTTTSNEATLTVIDSGPVITTDAHDVGFAPGKTIVISVVALGVETYQWQYRKPGTTEWIDMDGDNAHTSALIIQPTADMDGYEYQCLLYNLKGSTTSATAKISIVKNAPKITTQPVKLTVTEGNNAIFTVTATGDALSYQWQRKLKGKSWEDCPDASAKTATLVEYSVTYAQNGASYRCIVKNAKKPNGVKSKTVKLTVKGLPPTIVTDPSDATVFDGSNVTFTVVATGTGTLKYQWYYLKPSATKGKKCSGASAKTASYTFKASIKKTGYKYYVVVTNNGTDLASAAAEMTVLP